MKENTNIKTVLSSKSLEKPLFHANLIFPLFLYFGVHTGTHWLEFFLSVDLKNIDVNKKMSLEPTWTEVVCRLRYYPLQSFILFFLFFLNLSRSDVCKLLQVEIHFCGGALYSLRPVRYQAETSTTNKQQQKKSKLKKTPHSYLKYC